jgi:prolycopene isomerase
MLERESSRRAILSEALAAAGLLSLNWESLPAAQGIRRAGHEFDAVIVGSGLGGLSCAAAFVRKGYSALVIEQHDKPGGYATAFRRPGGFLFDVSLHSTGGGERNALRNLIGGFPEITEVEFVQHPNLYRAIFPGHDVRVPQRDLPGYIAALVGLFPEEKSGIEALFRDMRALSADLSRLSNTRAQPDMSQFPSEYPALYEHSQQTWGQMVDARLRSTELKAIVSAQWAYYGLPPSQLSSFYYALPSLGYLESGGWYPRGRSQTISDALVKFIEASGGKVLLGTRVDRILTRDGAAYGVHCAGGEEFQCRAVVSNASADATFKELLPDSVAASEYKRRIANFSTSLSCFQVFLGLNQDLATKLAVKDSEVFVEPGYDPDAGYAASRRGDVERCGFCVTICDNIFKGYSPAGKNTINVLCLQGFEPWERFEKDYLAGRKAAYRTEKERMAGVLIQRAEKALLPGLSRTIEVKEIGTPLTNLRYTANSRGAIYGWDQTVSNSGNRRVGHSTPIQNLFMAGAWSSPGHGYGAVLQSGASCFEEIVRKW